MRLKTNSDRVIECSGKHFSVGDRFLYEGISTLLLDIAQEMAIRCGNEHLTRFEAWSRLGDEARKLKLTTEEFLWKVVMNNLDDVMLAVEIEQDKIRYDRWLLLKAIVYVNKQYFQSRKFGLFNITARIKYRMQDRHGYQEYVEWSESE